MHLTLKKEATKPASFNFLQQQSRFDEFVTVYNQERPHQALNMRYPAEVYTPAARVYRPPEEPEYPFHDRTIRVTQCGRICIGKRKINLSTVFAGQTLGIREEDDKIWLVSFLGFDLGFFDEDVGRVEPAPNPFESKVLTMSPERSVNDVSG
jgi:putative transposase